MGKSLAELAARGIYIVIEGKDRSAAMRSIVELERTLILLRALRTSGDLKFFKVREFIFSRIAERTTYNSAKD